MGPIRRIVTTNKPGNGEAVVMIDAATPYVMERKEAGVVSHGIWATTSAPADAAGPKDRAQDIKGIPPMPNGTVCRVVDFLPGVDDSKLDANHMMQGLGKDASTKGWKPRHPAMHRTKSVDYAIVLEGEIDMLLDTTEVHLKTGDILVQNATNHAWVNRGTKPCRICFVLVDAKD